mmetsp:Transcript_43103/g.93898  ORF Transcript_43103/g.93898 Transcript_43103/m.93898 type:complete len:211 (-) Transcript_43103:729-1361(-)
MLRLPPKSQLNLLILLELILVLPFILCALGQLLLVHCLEELLLLTFQLGARANVVDVGAPRTRGWTRRGWTRWGWTWCRTHRLRSNLLGFRRPRYDPWCAFDWHKARTLLASREELRSRTGRELLQEGSAVGNVARHIITDEAQHVSTTAATLLARPQCRHCLIELQLPERGIQRHDLGTPVALLQRPEQRKSSVTLRILPMSHHDAGPA